jgi:hypothetical protein
MYVIVDIIVVMVVLLLQVLVNISMGMYSYQGNTPRVTSGKKSVIY